MPLQNTFSHNKRQELAAFGVFASAHSLVLTGKADALRRLWIARLAALFRPLGVQRISAPPMIEEAILARTNYLKHFPHQVVSQCNQPSTGLPTLFSTPAACLHCYPLFENETIDDEGLTTLLVEGPCERYESGCWAYPFRLASFTMLELVGLGAQERVRACAEEAERLLLDCFASAELPVQLLPATDSFYLANDRAARIIQQLKGLKKEFVHSQNGQEISIASRNLHENFFTTKFSINLQSGQTAHSFCIAIGLERLVVCSILEWGRKKWPGEFAV